MIASEGKTPNVGKMVGSPAVREVIPRDPRYSVRWHRHGYPSPIARWNRHAEYELHLITEGTGRYIVGDTVGSFGAGQLVLVGPELPHHWISDLEPGETIPERDVVLQFHEDWIRSCMEILPELSSLRSILTNSTRGIEFLGESAVQGAELMCSIGDSSGTDRLAKTFALFAVLAEAPERDRRYLANEWIPSLDQESSAVVGQALEYVFSNLEGDVRLSVAAGMVGMSDSAFSRYFKRASGQTFSDIVKKLRLAHACKLLNETTEPIAFIASAVGYRNLSNFNRQFRAELGKTPAQYRKGC
jgi:AraC-like DNA-binding protein